MLRFRVDAIVRAEDGTVSILADHLFEAETPADAEKVAHDWAKAKRLAASTAISLRIIKAEMILADRQMGETEWTRC
jgi:hypothetical protein